MTLLTPIPTLDPIDAEARATLFTDARTANTFSATPVSDEQLTDIWKLARWAPTSANVQPLRLVFIRTPEGKSACSLT
jgi:3-hydroxypropanoate dehydrogenase